MRKPHLRAASLASLASVALLAVPMLGIACSSSSDDPAPSDPLASSSSSPTGSSTTNGATTTTTPTSGGGNGEWTPPTLPTRSSACGTALSDGNLSGVNATTSSGRAYHVWGPSGYDPSKAYPVVMMFHGIGVDGPAFESWFQMENYVEGSAFVVYADAQGGQWDTDGTSDLHMFDDVVAQLGNTYCIDPSHVYGFGFSLGAYFVNHLGCERAGYVRAIAAGEGGFGGGTNGCGRLPVFITNRTLDTNEVVGNGKNAAEKWTSLDVCDSATTSNADFNCTIHGSCKKPGGTVTFCEDTSDMSSIAGYDPSWDHTVRENYRAFVWTWFKSQ